VRSWVIFTITVIGIFSFTPVFGQSEIGFYENEFYDYSFEIPMNWKIMEDVDPRNTKGLIIQTLIFPEGFTPLINSTPMVEVHFLNIPKSEVALLNAKNLEEYQRKIVMELLPQARIIESSSENTDWGWKVTVESKVSNLHIIDTLFVFPDRESYTVGYVAIEEDYFDLYKPVYDNILETMVIKGVVVPEFQEITMIILASSIVMIVIITRKMNFSILILPKK